MLSVTTNLLPAQTLHTLQISLDPLEQFDVLSLSLPLIGGGLTNLSLLLGFNIILMAA